MVRKVSKEIEKELVEQYYDATAPELSKKYNINPSTIRAIWRRNGCIGKNNFNPNEEEFIRIYNSNTIQETANYYQRNRHTIVRKAQSLGIYHKPKPVLTKEQEQEIIEQYESKTSTELAKEYNVSKSKIVQVWSKANLKGKDAYIYHYDKNFFDKIDSDEKAYWVGFIAADGCIYCPKNNRQKILSISLSIEDESHLEKLNKSLHSNKPISYTSRKGEKGQLLRYCNLQFSSDKLCDDLIKIGVTPKKTYSVNFPKISENFLPAYIRGYFDGDGSISKSFEKNTLHICNVTITGFSQNLRNFQNYLESNGIKSSLVKDKRDYHKEENEFFGHLTFTNKDMKKKFLHFIYDNASVYLDRKYLLAQKFFSLCKENPRTWTIKDNSNAAQI